MKVMSYCHNHGYAPFRDASWALSTDASGQETSSDSISVCIECESEMYDDQIECEKLDALIYGV